MYKGIDNVRNVIEAVSGIALIAMATIVIVQVIARYVFNNSLSWSEEAARFLQVWITFLGASIALKRGMHIGIDFLTSHMTGVASRLINIFISLMVALFSVIIIVNGTMMTIQQLTYGQSSAGIGIPMFAVYLAMPVGGAFMLVESVIQLINHVKSKLESQSS